MKAIKYNGKVYEFTAKYDSKKRAVVYTTAAGKLVKGQDEFFETYVPQFSDIEVIALPVKQVKVRKVAKSEKYTAKDYFENPGTRVLVERINAKAREESNEMIVSISERALRDNELSQKQEWCLAYFAEKFQLSFHASC